MIPRYTRPEMGRIWTDDNKFQKWLDVEVATAEAEADAGLIPKSALMPSTVCEWLGSARIVATCSP